MSTTYYLPTQLTGKPIPTKYKAYVRTTHGSDWSTNALEFDSEDDAQAWVDDLFLRWTAVRESCVRPVGINPNDE